ncbi:MAG: nucleoside recognition domain-containing protein [Christensenellales bacterium]|jgi:ferrous iron transport protein B
MVIALPLIEVIDVLISLIQGGAAHGLSTIGVPAFWVAFVTDAVLSSLKFAMQMLCFVFGVSFVFGLIEEVGYMARISYVFDGAMSKLGLQGKAVMPFLVSFGCNIGGSAGTRVLDSWGQRVTAIATSWVVPCSATWGVIGLMGGTFFGSGAVLVILSLFVVAILHMVITSKIFGKQLLQENDRCGMIMELPPYHKPKWGNLFRFVGQRMGDVFRRAVKIILIVAVVFWFLSYTPDGNIANSFIYKAGVFIEPVTMFFGLRWQMFIAFICSGLGKEASLGVLASLFEFGSNGGRADS